MVLAVISGTQDWPAPAAPEAGVSAEVLHETALQNRALWRTLREQAAPALARLLQWHDCRGDLLRGLLAFVEPGVVLTLDQVRAFSAALEEVGHAGARARLNGILSSLSYKHRPLTKPASSHSTHPGDDL